MNPGFQQQTPWGAPQQGQQPQQATPWSTPGGGFQQPMQQAPQMPPPPGVAPISFDPTMFTQGGMIDNVVVRFTNCRAVIYSYGGKSTTSAPCFSTDLQILNQQTGQPQDGTAPQQQVWSVGKVEDFTVNAEGTGFVPLTGKRGANENSKFALLVKSLVASAFPVDLLRSGNVKAMEGMVAFVQREAVKYDGLKKAAGGGQGTGGGGDEQTVLLVREIKQLPGGMQVQAQPAPQQFAPPPQQQQPMQQAPQFAQPQVPQMPQFAQPMQAQAPIAPMPQFAPAPTPQAPAPLAGPQLTQDDANVLRAVMATNPATMGNFTIALFQATVGNEERRRMLQQPQVQAAVLGAPVSLPQ